MDNGYATLVLKSDAVFTGDGSMPFEGGVAMADGKILACGDDAAIEPLVGPDTEVREYRSKLIMPGFNDSHLHIMQGALLDDPDFCLFVGETNSVEECLQRLKEYGDEHPDNEWLYGAGVIQFLWDDPTMPTAAQIDAVIPDRPVVLSQVDNHTFSANTAAMRKAGVTRDTPDPEGGAVLRDADGNPTGVFSNTAGDYILDPVFHPTWESFRNSCRKTLQTFKRLGITSAACMYPEGMPDDGPYLDPYKAFQELDDEGELSSHLYVYQRLLGDDLVSDLRRFRDEYNVPGSKITYEGFKILIDGVASDHTAWMAYPYANDPTTNGSPSRDLDEVRENVFKACDAGFPVRIHAIGDRAVNWALDTFAEARRRYGDKGLRHVLEHVETIQPDDILRFSQLGVAACVQPMHALLDLPFLAKDEAVGPERLPYCWPFRSLLDAGAVLGLATDYPVVELDPLHGVYAAVTRQLFDGTPEGGWTPAQRITLAEALKAYTWGSAYVEGHEDSVGTLAPGMDADVIVLSKDLFSVEPSAYLDTEVELTVFNGNVVYEA
jgi:predicted amidohydrolase YtcJ